MWIEAQKYFLSVGEIPNDVWFKAALDEELITCGLAKRTATGVLACGQAQQFAWLKLKQESGRIGGLKSVASRRQKSGTAQPRRSASNLPKHPEASASENPKHPEAPRSLFSLNTSEKNKKSLLRSGEGFASPTGNQKFIGEFVKAYQKTYGVKTRPELGPKVQGQIKNFLKGRSVDEAIILIQVYMQMRDPWFIKKCHDFTTFTENIQKVKLSFETGKDAGQKRSRTIKEILTDQITMEVK
jgi:hypothetical protein